MVLPPGHVTPIIQSDQDYGDLQKTTKPYRPHGPTAGSVNLAWAMERAEFRKSESNKDSDFRLPMSTLSLLAVTVLITGASFLFNINNNNNKGMIDMHRKDIQ